MIRIEGALSGAEAARRLAKTGLYECGPGLTDAEFEHIEHEYGFEFADDHRAFLAAGLPINVPPEGVLLDVEHSGYWHESWGERPVSPAVALERARQHLAKAPVLVPVYAHRYLPAGRGTSGHPVLSMWQTDTIYYGENLVDYIHREFDETRDEVDEGGNPRATVPFWRDLLARFEKATPLQPEVT
ncbi:hypothetical protein ACWDO7_16170 [Streptomyces sp. NPDC003656]